MKGLEEYLFWKEMVYFMVYFMVLLKRYVLLQYVPVNDINFASGSTEDTNLKLSYKMYAASKTVPKKVCYLEQMVSPRVCFLEQN